MTSCFFISLLDTFRNTMPPLIGSPLMMGRIIFFSSVESLLSPREYRRRSSLYSSVGYPRFRGLNLPGGSW